MRHRDARQRLTQGPAHSRMLKRNLVTSLLLYETVRTTRSRARAVQPIIDRLLRTARKQPTHVAIRTINSFVTDKNACRKIIEVLKARYQDRPSGLTRMVPAGTRQGDGAMVVDLKLVNDADVAPAETEKTSATTKKTPVKKAPKKTSAKKK